MDRSGDAKIMAEPSARLIAEAAPIGIFRADPAGRVTYINPALERISGVPVQRALGKSWLRSAFAEAREGAEKEWQAAIAAGDKWETEFRFKHPDGSTRYASILTAVEHDKTGAVRGVTGFVTDITAQRADQAHLKTSERRFRLLAENATDIIVRLDLDDHVTYASPAMGEVTGFSAEETRGINPISFMHPDDSAAAKECSRQLKAGEIDQAIIEYRTPHKDGHYIWVEARSRLVFDRGGQPHEVISVVRDISEHKRLQSELTIAREAERQASAAQSRFLATMSHEIRTPISGVIGMIDLLVAAKDDEQVPRYRAALASSARTLLRVVDDVLDYSRLSSVGIALETASFDVFATIYSVIDLYRPAAEAKGVTLGLSFQARDRQATGDATRLSQILGNLISNAIKFTDRGRIDVNVGQAQDRWTIAVIDTGIGISRDQQKSLFTAFSQADATIATRFGGTGLGLTIARLIVEAMGGSITVNSVPGEGAAFSFDIVLHPAVDPLETPSHEELRHDHRVMDILVADDNEVNLLYLSRVLEQLGHRVVAVKDGAEAVEAARATRFDAVFLDHHMPRLDGTQAARAIRRLDDHQKCLLVMVSAARSLPAKISEPAPTLFDAILSKPIRREQLEQVLAAHDATDGGHASSGRHPSPRDAMVQTLGPDAADHLEQLFRLDLETRMKVIEKAFLNSDIGTLQREAHAIAGAAELIGEQAISEAAYRVETALPEVVVDSANILHRRCLDYLAVNATLTAAARSPVPTVIP